MPAVWEPNENGVEQVVEALLSPVSQTVCWKFHRQSGTSRCIKRALVEVARTRNVTVRVSAEGADRAAERTARLREAGGDWWKDGYGLPSVDATNAGRDGIEPGMIELYRATVDGVEHRVVVGECDAADDTVDTTHTVPPWKG